MRETQKKHLKDGIDSIPKKTLIKLATLLNENGFLRYRIADRIYHDFHHPKITEQYAESMLSDIL